MLLEDLLVLAIAKPVKLSDGRLSRCVIGYSEDLKSLVRLYPTYHKSKKIKEGNVVRVPVIKGDSRENTFKLKGSKDLKKADWGIVVVDTLTPKKVYQLLSGLRKTTIKELNEAKKSMGIIKPINIRVIKKDKQVRMLYEDGSKHNQQVLDLKQRHAKWNNPLLIVGNHYAHRNSFMVVSWKNGTELCYQTENPYKGDKI